VKPSPSMQRLAMAVVAAAAIAIPFEGYYSHVYKDPVGIDTYCIGTTKDPVSGKTYTLHECLALLSEDMAQAVQATDKCQPGLPFGVLVAFSDAVYNMGPTIACDRRNSTAARLLDAKQYEAACNQLPRWNKARVAGNMIELPGLTKRREREREVCLNAVGSA
jgi:lysozyme